MRGLIISSVTNVKRGLMMLDNGTDDFFFEDVINTSGEIKFILGKGFFSL